MIAEALDGRNAAAMLADLNEMQVDWNFRAKVNDTYPRGFTHEVPIILLYRLPALPEDLEYRVVNRDLVLWDMHADLVVDVLRDAFGFT